MNWKKIVYRSWVVESAYHGGNEEEGQTELSIGRRPIRPPEHVKLRVAETVEDLALTRLREQVGAAVAQLNEEERELIERFYYAGDSYFEIARALHVSPRRLEAVHRRALKRLKKILAPLVRSYYGLTKDAPSGCPICESEHRGTIDELIGDRDRTRSWKPVMREIRDRCGVRIKSPMTLIGHEKYH
jgi:rubrerythrin